MKKWDYEGDFLTQFDTNFRGAIGNMFCVAFREGSTSVDSMLASVGVKISYTLKSSWERGESVYWRVLNALQQPEAREFAEHIIWRESLPDEERARLKAEAQAEGVKSWMATQKPTNKQLSYLNHLGCEKVPENKAEASELINSMLAQRAAKAKGE